MRRIAAPFLGALLALVISASFFIAALADSSTPTIPIIVPFDKLPGAGAAGQMAYVTDCRAIVSVSGVGLVTQVAGAGTGCLATSNGSVWQIDGTTIPVSR